MRLLTNSLPLFHCYCSLSFLFCFVLQIACGGDFAPSKPFCCGATGAGTISCFGDNTYHQLEPPAGAFSNIAVGRNFACAIRNLEGYIMVRQSAWLFPDAIFLCSHVL